MGKEIFRREKDPGYLFRHDHTPSDLAKANYFYLQNIGYGYFGKKFIMQREGLLSLLLIYTESGKGYLDYRGKHYELVKGRIMLINCFDYQEYQPDEILLWNLKWIHFFGSTSEGYYNVIYEKYGPVIDLQEDFQILHYIETLKELLIKYDVQFEIKASGIIHQILVSILLDAPPKSSIHDSKNPSSPVENVIEFIKLNYADHILLTDLAKAAGYSENYLFRIFKKETGYRPYEYLIKYRISKAKFLLSNTNKSVEDISHLVGYDSAANFISQFKRLESMTPLKYRNRL
jgi:AraC family transcriptional regulator